VVGFRGQLAIEAEEALLIRGEGSDVNFVLLVRIHGGYLAIVVLLWNENWPVEMHGDAFWFNGLCFALIVTRWCLVVAWQ